MILGVPTIQWLVFLLFPQSRSLPPKAEVQWLAKNWYHSARNMMNVCTSILNKNGQFISRQSDTSSAARYPRQVRHVLRQDDVLQYPFIIVVAMAEGYRGRSTLFCHRVRAGGCCDAFFRETKHKCHVVGSKVVKRKIFFHAEENGKSHARGRPCSYLTTPIQLI